MSGRGPRAAAALAALLAAAPAVAYLRTADPITGRPLSWPVPAVPWHLNREWPHSAPSCEITTSGADPTLDAVRASFAAWQQPCTDLRLLYAGPSTELRVGTGGAGGNVVVFRRGWCSQHPQATANPCWTAPDGDCAGLYGCFHDAGPGDWSIVALTSVLYEPSTGRIISADVEVNGWDGAAGALAPGAPAHGWYFTCYPDAGPSTTCTSYGQDGCRYMDLRNTVTHEVGHFLGLAHPCTTELGEVTASLPWCSSPAPGQVPYDARTMSPSTQPGDLAKRGLSEDEVAAVCDVYPAASGGCACGAGTGGGAAALLLLAAGARPWRRAALRRR